MGEEQCRKKTGEGRKEDRRVGSKESTSLVFGASEEEEEMKDMR